MTATEDAVPSSSAIVSKGSEAPQGSNKSGKKGKGAKKDIINKEVGINRICKGSYSCLSFFVHDPVFIVTYSVTIDTYIISLMYKWL